MAKFALAWVNTGKMERELALEYGLKRVCIIQAGTDTSVLEKLVLSANLGLESADKDQRIQELENEVEDLQKRIDDAMEELEG